MIQLVDQPLVSIIIPTYNRIASVGYAIESVINQTYSNIEIIVVDDGSDDHTEKLVSTYPGVIYILQEHAGQAKARNTGLKASNGLFIASLDSDDTWNPKFLERCMDKLTANEFSFVFTNWVQQVNPSFGYDQFVVTKLLNEFIHENSDPWITLSNQELRSLYIAACPSPSSSLVIRRSSIRSGWNEQLNIADDWCLLLDMIFQIPCKAAFTTEKLWTKKVDGKNIYDGRDYFEVIENLYIKDFDNLIERYQVYLTTPELERLKYKSALNIYRFSLNRLFKGINISSNLFMLKRAFYESPKVFFEVISTIITNKIQKKLSLKKVHVATVENFILPKIKEMQKVTDTVPQ